MGSFDYTCCVSGLPIAGGEAVRYLLLTQNPYHQGKKAGSFVCYSTDHWFPRVFPIRGEYDTYGRAEKLQGKAQQAVWLRGFQKDLAECGWGENAVHDKAMSKTMTLDELLDGIHMGRLHVRRNSRHADAVNKDRKKIPTWIPTRRRVEKLIVKLGLKKYEGEWGSDAFIVSRVDRITVKVRDAKCGGTNETERLTKLRDALADRYAGMVTCGTGRGSDHAELILRPLPGTEPRGCGRMASPKSEKARIAAVASAMIREDVWQAIVSLPPYDEDVAVAVLRKNIRDAFDERVKCRIVEMSLTNSEEDKKIRDLLRMAREVAPGNGLVRNAVPFSVGLEESWSWMVDEIANGGDPQEAEAFCNTVAEFEHVSGWLSTVRFLWHPAGGGPQCGEHKQHLRFLQAVADVAAANAKRQR